MSRLGVKAYDALRHDEDGHPRFSWLPIRPPSSEEEHNGIEGLSLAQRMHFSRGTEVLR